MNKAQYKYITKLRWKNRREIKRETAAHACQPPFKITKMKILRIPPLRNSELMKTAALASQ